MSIRDELENLSAQIKRQRDEVRVQLHLANEELKDEWDNVEKHWESFRGTLDQITRDAEQSGDQVVQKAREMGEEIRKGYDRIRSRL